MLLQLKPSQDAVRRQILKRTRDEDNGFLPTITKTRYGLGARGVDFVSTQVDSGSKTVKFPSLTVTKT